MIYRTDDNNLVLEVSGAMQGWRVTVMVWDNELNDYYTPLDRYMITDSLHEAVCWALTESYDLDWEQADFQAAEWGITAPEYDEESE